jgi:CRP-like cAMP-binding protein
MSEVLSNTQSVSNTSYEVVKVNKGDYIISQFEKSNYIYFLQEGEISFEVYLASETDSFEIGKTSKKNTPIGWSGLNFPHRYATSVKASSEVLLEKWSISDVLESFLHNPESGISFLKSTCSGARLLMIDILDLISSENIPTYSFDQGDEHYDRVHKKNQNLNLRKSPFFEVFEEEVLTFFEDWIQLRHYRAGDLLFEQQKYSDGIYVLQEGWIDFYYQRKMTAVN